MKRILILLCLPLLFNSCGKSDVTPQTMEDIIIEKKWWDITDEDGMLLTEEGDFYYLQVCHQDSLMGTWIIDGDLIKLRFYVNSIEYTLLIGEVTSYTNTELKIKVQTNDTNLQANYVFTTEFIEIIGCTDATAANYNPLANCDDGSCVPFIYGCTDSTAANYNPLANIDDDSCCYVAGCTDILALNYNPNACYDDNSCKFRKTYVPDDNFENYLENNGMGDGIPLNDSVLTANINTVTYLNVSYSNIADLTGIEDFTALTILNCNYNQLTSLDVSNNTALISLGSNNNQLTTLDVSQNTALTVLYCFSNQLTTLDVRNGNNMNMYFITWSNSQLTCISVDDSTWSTNNWTVANGSIDPHQYFSEQCP